MNLASYLKDFLKYLEIKQSASPLTIKNYDHWLSRFLAFARLALRAKRAGDIKPSSIDINIVKRYKVYLSGFTDPKTKKPLKAITQNYFLIALRGLLRYLAQANIESLPAEKVELKRQDPEPHRLLAGEQLTLLLDAPDKDSKDGLRDRCILETLFSTGLRVSELTFLDRDLIDLQKRQFEVKGKGAVKRVVFLSESAAIRLEKYLFTRKDSFKPLFIRYQGKIDPAERGEKMRLTPRSIERIVEKYVKKIRLSIKATPHTLRYAFAEKLLIKGVDAGSLQERLGLMNIASTRIYTPQS